MNRKLPSMKSLWLRCFPEDNEDFVNLFYSYYSHPTHYATIEEGNEVIAMLHHINAYRYRFFGQTQRCSYIYAACTASDHRKRGLMKELILSTFDQLLLQKIPLCVTIPANQELFAYYARFGFVPAFKRMRLKREESSRPKQVLEGMRLNFEIPVDCLASWMTKRINRRGYGCMRHTARDLQFVLKANLLSGGFHVGLLNGEEQLEAAAIVERVDNALLVREAAGESSDAVSNLFHLLHEAISLPLIEEMPGESCSPTYFGAARIIHLPTLLQAPDELPGQLPDESFYIHDELIPANNGLYCIENHRCRFQSCAPPLQEHSSLQVYDIAEYSSKLFAIETGYMSLMMD